MSKKPTVQDLHVAASWLDAYEGVQTNDEDEQACQRVRKWLLAQADAAEFRQACREFGVSVAQARKGLR